MSIYNASAIRLLKTVTLRMVVLLLACYMVHPSTTLASNAEVPHNVNPGGYCGVQALQRAFTSLGKEVPFGELVEPKYIGSKLGSSLADLERAAKDFGFDAVPIYHVNAIFLFDVRDPLILHTKSEHGLNRFNHWVLFMGVENGQARICDGTNDIKLIDFVDLAELWDGNGLVVSRGPLSKASLYFSSYGIFFVYVLAGIVCFSLVGFVDRHRMFRNARLSSPFYSIGREVVILLSASIVLPLVFTFCNTTGFLNSRDAILAIKKQYVFTRFGEVKLANVEASIVEKNSLLVDARRVDDYELGHLPGAINIPPSFTEEECANALKGVTKRSPLILYCQSNGCPFSKIVGEKLTTLGFEVIRIYPDGWVGWQEHHR